MVLSVFTTLINPVQASISNDDVAMIMAVEPAENVFYDSGDVIDWAPQIIIENQYPFNSDPRSIKVEVCGGNQTLQSVCPSQDVLIQSTALSNGLAPAGAPGDSETVTFSSFLWFIDSADLITYSGVFTVMFHFEVEDSNPVNDHMKYTITIEEDLTDLVVNGHDVDTSVVYNSNAAIPANNAIKKNINNDSSDSLVEDIVANSLPFLYVSRLG